MLKLMKNDIVEHRKFGYIAISFIAFILIQYLLSQYTNSTIAFTITTFLTIFAFSILITIYNIYYLYSSTYSNKSYLVFKLGISRKTVLTSRITLAFIVNLVLYAIIFAIFYLLMINIFISIPEAVSGNDRINFLFERESLYLQLKFLSPFLINIVIGLLVGIIDPYLAMGLGNMINKSKILFSFIFYIVINFINQVISSIVALIFFQNSIFTSISSSFNSNGGSITIGDSSMNFENFFDMTKPVFYVPLIMTLILLIIKLVTMYYVADKKLNI